MGNRTIVAKLRLQAFVPANAKKARTRVSAFVLLIFQYVVVTKYLLAANDIGQMSPPVANEVNRPLRKKYRRRRDHERQPRHPKNRRSKDNPRGRFTDRLRRGRRANWRRADDDEGKRRRNRQADPDTQVNSCVGCRNGSQQNRRKN